MRFSPFRLFLLLVLFLGLLIVALPSIVSTEWGKKQVIAWVNRSIPGKIEIRSLSLQWGKGQALEGFLLKDPTGQAVLEAEKFFTDATLWQLLQKSTHLGKVQLQELNAVIATDEKGVTNLQRALSLNPERGYPHLLTSPILLSDVNSTLSLLADQKTLSAHVTGTTRQDTLVGSFDIDIFLPDLYASNWNELTQDAQKYLSLEGSKNAKLHAHIINFPVDLIDRLVALKKPELGRFFHSILGEKLDLILTKEPHAEGLVFNLEATSPLMQGNIKGGKIDQGMLSLQEAALFDFHLQPDSLRFCAHHFELLDAAHLKVICQDLHIPLAFFDAKAPVDFCQFGFKTHAELSPTPVEVFPIGEFKINFLNIDLESALCQSDIHVKVEGQGEKDQKPFDIDFEFFFSIPLDKGEEDFHIESSIKQIQLPRLLSLGTIQLNGIVLKVEGKDLLDMTAHLTIDQLMASQTTNFPFSLEKLSVSCSVDTLQNRIQGDLKGFAHVNNGQLSPVSSTFSLHQWLSPSRKINWDHVKTEMTADLTAFPTPFVSALLHQKDLSPLIGPTLDINLSTLIDRDQQVPGYWDMYIDSKDFHAKTRLKMDSALALYESANPSGEFRWTLTSEGYRHLQSWLSSSALPNLNLAEPVTLSGHLSELNLPLPISKAIHQGQVALQFHTTPFKWKELPSLAPFKVEGFIKSHQGLDELALSLQALSNDSSLTFNGHLTHVLDAEGNLQNWQQMSLHAAIQAHQLPSRWAQALLFLDDKQEKRLEALLGKTIEADLQVQLERLSGPIQAKIEGENGHAKLNGRLQQGVLFLQDPFIGHIRVTPDLSQALLADYLPFLSSAFGADNPLTLRIDPQGFSCPLIPFNFNQILLEKGVMEMGKVHFHNEGELASLLSLIRPIPGKELTLWFTPLYFQLNKGLFSYKRLDLLVAHQYRLASWGEIDFNTQKAFLTVGVSEQALRYAFNIQGLDPNYLLQIPIKGRKGSIEIDRKRAAGRISALIAQWQGDSKTKLLGQVLEAGLSKDDGAAPPPTTKPFPWAHEFQEAQPEAKEQVEPDAQDAGHKKRKRSKELDADRLIKDIEQNASSLLNQFIK